MEHSFTADDTTSFLALRLTTTTSGHWVKIKNLTIFALAWDETGDFIMIAYHADPWKSIFAQYIHQTGLVN